MEEPGVESFPYFLHLAFHPPWLSLEVHFLTHWQFPARIRSLLLKSFHRPWIPTVYLPRTGIPSRCLLYRLKKYIYIYWGTWVAPSVERPTLDFSSGHDLRVMRSGSTFSRESASLLLSLSLGPSACLCMCTCTLSLSEISKSLKNSNNCFLV